MEHGSKEKGEETHTEGPQRLVVVHVTMHEPDSDLPIQAGRSSSSLHAERAAALLESTKFQPREEPTSSPDNQRRDSHEQDRHSVSEKKTSRPTTSSSENQNRGLDQQDERSSAKDASQTTTSPSDATNRDLDEQDERSSENDISQTTLSTSDNQNRNSGEQEQRHSLEKQTPRASTTPLTGASEPQLDCAVDRTAIAGITRINTGNITSPRVNARPDSPPPGLRSAASRHVPRYQPSMLHGPSPLGRTSQVDPSVSSLAPLTIHDLGSDYTRYFDPIGDCFEGKASSPSSRRSLTCAPANGDHDPSLTPAPSETELIEYTNTKETLFLIDDRLSAPYEEKNGLTWPRWGDEAEEDDAMHLPHPDDDELFKLRWTECFKTRHIIPTMGVILVIVGLLVIFIVIPVLSSLGIIDYTAGLKTPSDQSPLWYPHEKDWAWVNNKKYPLLKNLRKGLIDPDTPEHAMQMVGEFGDEYELVFSDEFNDNNRTFYEGDDPYFYAADLWYGATQDLEWYDPDAVTTWDGVLELRMDRFKNHGLEFRSGMLNSWNHLCFKGGIFEVSMSLPGPAGVHGLWPGAWALGNLGRPGYMSTTDGTWPYTYQACDVGITPNQSDPDGISWLPGQKLPSCTCPGEDHPSPGTGRGAPEIDIAEVGANYGETIMPIATQSYQVAPFDIWYYPNYNFTAFPDHRLSYPNSYTGGHYQQAISGVTTLHHDWYDGKAYQRFSFEYVPGDKEHAHITWKVGGQTMFSMDERAVGPNGNIQARQISREPMSLILNLAISNSWTWINWERLVFPAILRVDYVRWYQKKDEEKLVTCDPPGFETTDYINQHIYAYTNPNLTTWDQTGYGWPKHKLNSMC